MRNGRAAIVGALTIVAALFPSRSRAEELNDAKEILKRADEAARKVETTSYSAAVRSTGWLESRAPGAEGDVLIGGKGKTPQDPIPFRVKLKTTPQGAGEPIELTGGSDGDLFFLVDPAAKTVYEDIDPAVMGRNARLFQALMMRPLAMTEPFEDEFKATKLELKESQEVGGEQCYQLYVTYEGQGEGILFIAKKDFLPRRRDRILTNREGEKASRELSITNLEVNPKLPADAFKAQVPEGFKKTDDFAP